jgi:hypothetical protein
MPDDAIIVKGGSLTLEFNPHGFKEDSCRSRRIFNNPNARITRIEVVGNDSVIVWYSYAEKSYHEGDEPSKVEVKGEAV